jgi:hypothetical protein
MNWEILYKEGEKKEFYLNVFFDFSPDEDYDKFTINEIYYNKKIVKNISNKNMKKIINLLEIDENNIEDVFFNKLKEDYEDYIGESAFSSTYGNIDNWLKGIRIN